MSVGEPTKPVPALADHELQQLADEVNEHLYFGKQIARRALVIARWKAGRSIRSNGWYKKHSRDAKPILERLSALTNLGLRDVYRCVQFWDKFPVEKEEDVPGETWEEVCNELLPALPDEAKEEPNALLDEVRSMRFSFLKHKAKLHELCGELPEEKRLEEVWVNYLAPVLQELERAVAGEAE